MVILAQNYIAPASSHTASITACSEGSWESSHRGIHSDLTYIQQARATEKRNASSLSSSHQATWTLANLLSLTHSFLSSVVASVPPILVQFFVSLAWIFLNVKLEGNLSLLCNQSWIWVFLWWKQQSVLSFWVGLRLCLRIIKPVSSII